MTSLKLGSMELWQPPKIAYELTGSRSNYSSSNCGSQLESTDLTYKLFISGQCSLAESQMIEQNIRAELETAPNLTVERQDTFDALLFRNRVQKGTLDYSNDQAELRARFTRKRTLALQLVLTILPEGAGNGDARFRQLSYITAIGAFDWVNDPIKGLLFDEDSTVPDELYATSLDDFVNLSELPGAGRVEIANREVVQGSQTQLLGDDPTFAETAGAVGMILFQDNGADDLSVPLFLISFPEMDGSDLEVHFDLLGLF
jgi:hypothetical protein